MTAPFLDRMRDEVAVRLEHGASRSEVQTEFVDAVLGLGEDERAALWLFAWSYSPSAWSYADRLKAAVMN